MCPLWGDHGLCWGFLGAILVLCWGYLGALGSYVVPCRSHIEAIWGHLWAILGCLGGNLGSQGPRMQKDRSVSTLLKCHNRSRSAPVKRERLPEKQRCHRTLKSHIFLKCRIRSRSAGAERERSMWRGPVRWGQSPPPKFLILHKFYTCF